MSMYRCEECQELINGDCNPCVEHPANPTAYCCESCADSIEIEMDMECKRMCSTNQQEELK